MIIDAFPMNDELQILELRLGQLDSVVDKFVLVETGRTFMGKPKPLYYQDNKERFAKWNHKIVHAAPELGNAGAWEFEGVQREVLVDMIRGLNPSPDDTLSFSDCDEIPNPDVLKNYTPELGLRNLKQLTFYYNFNSLMDYGNRAWSRARLGRVKDVQIRGNMVNFRGGIGDMDPNFPALENGGWHGSFFGSSLERVRRKVNAISHDDLQPFINARTDRQLAEDIINGVDLFHRQGIGRASWVDTDDPRLPSYFRANKDKFKEFTNSYFVEVCQELLKG